MRSSCKGAAAVNALYVLWILQCQWVKIVLHFSQNMTPVWFLTTDSWHVLYFAQKRLLSCNDAVNLSLYCFWSLFHCLSSTLILPLSPLLTLSFLKPSWQDIKISSTVYPRWSPGFSSQLSSCFFSSPERHIWNETKQIVDSAPQDILDKPNWLSHTTAVIFCELLKRKKKTEQQEKSVFGFQL